MEVGRFGILGCPIADASSGTLFWLDARDFGGFLVFGSRMNIDVTSGLR